MTFTDDDLKRLKQLADAYRPEGVPITCGSLQALLARLEAAETLLDLWLQCDDDCEIDGSVFDAAMEAWLKAAGKS